MSTQRSKVRAPISISAPVPLKKSTHSPANNLVHNGSTPSTVSLFFLLGKASLRAFQTATGLLPLRWKRNIKRQASSAARAFQRTAARITRRWKRSIKRQAATSTQSLQQSTGLLSRGWKWILARQAAKSAAKRLSVAASLSLGEKRFVAVIQVDGRQFLIGGGATNVALLAQLDQKESFGNLLKETMAVPENIALVERMEKRA